MIIGQSYTRPELAKMWGFRSYEAIARGIITPIGTPFIILFITKEKQAFLFQYEDIFGDGILEIQGETNHAADQRIINATERKEEIHLFYRTKHHLPFIYEGQLFLSEYELYTDKPSRFRFAVNPATASADSSIATEGRTHGTFGLDFQPEEEGRKKLIKHIVYERSRRNRARAIELYGTSCLACGFNFNDAYGPAFAGDFIEVHHVKSITRSEGVPTDPNTDLIPLCSNCHSMTHRKRKNIVSLSELRSLLNRKRS